MQSRNELLYKLETSINKLRKFCCPDFDEINSREYYKEIIEKMCPETHNSYSYIFGDFDKLQSINQNYGFNMGNKALSNAMDIIKSALPDDAIISRLGGDEFSIILPNKDDKKSKFYIQQIHNALQKNANSIYGLTITLASASSNLGSIHELYNIAEKDVSKQKNRALNSNINNENFLPFNIKKEKMSDSELSSWEHLNTSIDSATYNFLKNIRASESFDFKPSELRNTATSMLNALNDLINKNIDKILSRYIFSQLLLSLIIGVLSFILLLILRVKFPLVLAIINGVANIIPYFGPIIGGIPIIFMALTSSVSKGIISAIGVFLIQQFEGNFLAPKITGDSTNMHPIVIIILLVLGDKIGGVIGMVLIVPIAVIIKVIYDDIDYYLF